MNERVEETVFSIWVNWNRRVVSFSPDEGFEELQFQTYDDKFRFAIEKGYEGFRIQ